MSNNKIEHIYIDKTWWPEGQWKDEPDTISWIDHETGYHCIIRRSETTGALCGYVAIPQSHRDYGKSYKEIKLNVHGGLTYSKLCDDTGKYWIFGFDCCHFNDLMPIFKLDDYNNNYRNVSYVRNEIEKLVKQLKERGEPNE